MDNRPVRSDSRLVTAAAAVAAVLIVCSMVAHPALAFDASMQGLKLWWNLVFPALLPFFILCEIVTAYGLAQAAGVLIEPVTRALLGLPGLAGWPIAAGLLAGSPAGAEAVAKLCKEGMLEPREADRLLALTHFANPVFIFSIVAVAFLQQPAAGPFLLAVHYGAALICALAIRPYGRVGRTEPPAVAGRCSLLRETAAALRRQRYRDGRAFGKVLGDAVTDSLQKLFMIGGTMMVFSVLLQLVRVGGLLPPPSGHSAAAAIAELHLGAYAVSHRTEMPLPFVIGATSGILGWGGLAIHLQVRALLQGTAIRYAPFFFARALHAAVAAIAAVLLWEPYQNRFAGEWPAFSAPGAAAAAKDPGLWAHDWWWPAIVPATALFVTFAIAVAAFMREGRENRGRGD